MNLHRTVRRTLTLALILGSTAQAQPWVDNEKAAGLVREEKYAEAAAAYKAIIDANPYDGAAWTQYGYSLHADKRYDEALKAYARAVELGASRPTNLYNTACALSLLGKKDEALAALETALNARFADQGTLENDTDLDPLRAEKRFAELTGLTRGLKEPAAADRDAGWRWDLDFFLRRMGQMHWDLDRRVSREALAREVEALKRDIANLTDDAARARLKRITAMVGDGHTASRLFAEGEGRRALPLHLFAFKDGVHIIGAAPAHAELLGAKVVRVGKLKIDDALTAVRPYISVDNPMGYLAQGPGTLMIPSILSAIGAGDDSGAELTVSRDGKETTVRVSPESFPAQGGGGFLTPGFKYLHDGTASTPLYLKDLGALNRVEYLPDTQTVYFRFWAVQNRPEGSLKDLAESAFNLIREHKAQHLVLDMRFNGGGNTGLIQPLVHGLIACDAVNKKGHLWVITGRHTFSAAQNTVNFIERNTKATFVGEPTGSCPQFVGESTSFILPHSKTRVFCSSRYWQQMDSTDERVWVQPAIAAEMTFADYASGKDAAMEAIEKWSKRAD